MDLIQKIHRTSLVLLVTLAVIAAFIEWKRLPLSILVGGLLGLLNLKAIAWGVQGLLGSPKAGTKMLFFSQFRLVMLFLLLAVLAYLKLVNMFGVLAGFTIVFTTIIIEGLRHSREPRQ